MAAGGQAVVGNSLKELLLLVLTIGLGYMVKMHHVNVLQMYG